MLVRECVVRVAGTWTLLFLGPMGKAFKFREASKSWAKHVTPYSNYNLSHIDLLGQV